MIGQIEIQGHTPGALDVQQQMGSTTGVGIFAGTISDWGEFYMKIDLQKKIHMKDRVFGEIRFPKFGLEDGVSGLRSLERQDA